MPGARVVYENPGLCFMTSDDEHHRIAFVAPPVPLTPRTPTAACMHHSAYTFAALDELLGRYAQLKTHGIEALTPIQHGVTTSLYYRDPDGNLVELQVDNFASPDAATAHMKGPEFAADRSGLRSAIVGGGGCGLTSSILLSDLGIDHRLVERHTGTSILPKAHYLNQRTMEILRQHGLAERVYAVDAPMANMGKVRWRRSYERDSPGPSSNCPQIRLEPLLRDEAEQRGPHRVRFNHELTALAQGADGVTVTVLDRGNGHSLTVRALRDCRGRGQEGRSADGHDATGEERSGAHRQLPHHRRPVRLAGRRLPHRLVHQSRVRRRVRQRCDETDLRQALGGMRRSFRLPARPRNALRRGRGGAAAARPAETAGTRHEGAQGRQLAARCRACRALSDRARVLRWRRRAPPSADHRPQHGHPGRAHPRLETRAGAVRRRARGSPRQPRMRQKRCCATTSTATCGCDPRSTNSTIART